MNIGSVIILVLILFFMIWGIRKIYRKKLLTRCSGDCSFCNGACKR